MTITDVRSLSPRRLIRGVMRGDRDDLKLGWPAEGAVDAVVNMHPDLDTDERSQLLEYARGFAAGLLGDGDEPSDATDAYLDGVDHGLSEPADETYPARPIKPRDHDELTEVCGCGAKRVGECAAAVEGYYTSLGQRDPAGLRELREDGCQAATLLIDRDPQL
jgi:hypothetical protein